MLSEKKKMYHLIIVFLPLFASFFSGLFGFLVGGKGASIITTTSVFISFFLSCCAFYDVALLKNVRIFEVASWIETEVYNLHWGFLFDTLTCVMLIVVTSISTLVHLYSTEYMKQDPHLARFMSYLSFFTFFMLILVTGDNLLQMFVGWEGVGLCSYLLINFWYGRIQANKAALKAMIVNRIGDFGLAIAIFTCYYMFQTLDYYVLFSIAPFFVEETVFCFDMSISLIDFIGFFLFIGAMGKSAQLGLHTWLPDAMEGPTPVSALIHAATMVTAGVFLICRCSPILEYGNYISLIIVVVGGMTAFFAATTGLLQNDLKRVIAYSTCSQLGYMVFAAGLSSYSVSVFHLANHAFFKALLFLGAGAVIHAMGDEQDMRKMGGLVKILPFTYAAILIGSLALMGFPFLTGFYSKDVILELAYGSFVVEGKFVHYLGCVAAFFTAYYSTRLLAMTFLRSPNGNRFSYGHAHEVSFRMGLPLFILSFASIFIGFVSRDMMIGLGSDFWGNALFTLPSKYYILEAEWLSTSVKIMPLIFSFAGAGLSVWHYVFAFDFLCGLKESKFLRSNYIFLNRKWFFDKVYNDFVTQTLLNVAYKVIYQKIDRGFLEFLGPFGLSTQIYKFTKQINEISLGSIYHYLFLFLVVLNVFLIFWGNILIFNFFQVFEVSLIFVLIFSIVSIIFIKK